MHAHPETNEQFIRHMTAAQGSVYAFILTLVPDRHAAADILQETNVALWRNAERFEPGTDFVAWACRTAHFQILTWRKTKARDRHTFDDSVFADLAERLANRTGEISPRLDALRTCLTKLTDAQRHALEQHYSHEGTVGDLADRLGRNVKAVYQMLFRARTALARCVQTQLTREVER